LKYYTTDRYYFIYNCLISPLMFFSFNFSFLKDWKHYLPFSRYSVRTMSHINITFTIFCLGHGGCRFRFVCRRLWRSVSSSPWVSTYMQSI
jgi:hypothetical protein